MADDTNNREEGAESSFDEFLNRAEEDFDRDDEEVDEALDSDDDGDSDDDFGSPLSSTFNAFSEENRARSLIDTSTMANPHGAIVEGANGGEGTIVRTAYLGKEMQASFLEYSMSVIVSRALPDVRDGLKPVHSSPYPVRHERERLHPQPPAYEVGPYRRRRYRQVPPPW